MKKDLTEIIFILDKSGSMESTKDETIQGFNNFLNEQKKLPGEAKMTLRLFASAGNDLLTYDGQDIKKIPALTEQTYQPNGWTALFDAIGTSINEVGERLANTPEEERPEKVIVVILTDGQENNSKHFTCDQIRDMITHQTDVYSWQFVYLGANQDAFANGSSLGIAKAGIANYKSTPDGTRLAYNSLNSTVMGYRQTGQVNINIPDAQN